MSDAALFDAARPQLLATAFDQAPTAMGVVDVAGRYLRVNRALCRLLGRPAAELTHLAYLETFHPADVDHESAAFARLATGEIPTYEAETRRVRPDGTVVWVHELVSAAYPGGRPRNASAGPPYVIRQLVDITRQRELTDALRDARREAEAARREAVEASRAKTEFLSRVSHELRTPLTAMLGFAELLEADDLAPAQAGRADHILVAGRHLLRLVDELLDLGRIEQDRLELRVEAISVPDVLADVDALVRDQAEAAGLAFSTLPAVGRPIVLADRRCLVEILLNLLTNAVKFTPAGGTVLLLARPIGDRTEISVTDSGPGLSPDEQRRLFMPFERLDAGRRGIPGTGLGLALSRRLAEAMDGRITVTSTPGAGSWFTVSLPAGGLTATGEDRPPAPVWSESRHGVLARRPWSALYVEDDPVNARLVDAILHRFTDAELTVATSADEALTRLASDVPDVMLLDLWLPDGSGADVLAHVRADPATRALPVVVLTADAVPARRDALLKAGAQAFLSKPISVRALLDTLADLLVSSWDANR